MSMPAKSLGSSKSETSLVNPKLSEKRRDRLISIKQREDLKDALTEKFKGRFGSRAAQRGDDEVSVASEMIKKEVNRFADTAAVTEKNLDRLERRLKSKALKKPDDTDYMSQTGVSAYSGMSRRSRSVTSIAGESVMRGEAQKVFDWARLDEYASYLHEQDAIRQKQGVVALQKKLKMDLDHQVAERDTKKKHQVEEESRYHHNMLIELENWKERETARAEEMRSKIMKEKQDRDDQLAFERRLKDEADMRKKEEEACLVDKIVNEMEAEQMKFEQKKLNARQAMRKVFEENMEDMKEKAKQQNIQKEKDANAMREYNRLLDEQEEARAEEMASRMARQKDLMEKMQANVAQLAKESGDNDALRAAKQQEEMDRHAFEAEKAKQERLKQMKLENQAYLIKQMGEKDWKKQEERELGSIQAQMLLEDSAEYNEMERQKAFSKRQRNFDHRMEIEGQIQSRAMQSVPAMSEAEIKINKGLLQLVDRSLTAKREIEEEEDDY